jgi:tetratricopeptide (TPR) repeat protein
VSFERALAEVKARPRDQHALEQLASQALALGEEERVLPLLDAPVRAQSSALLLQWKALLERALDRHDQALRSFEAAAALAPNDAGIAHGLARTALEAGVPAERHYERALQLAPDNGQVLLGLAAARLASGHGEQSARELGHTLTRSPRWIEGHMQLAQLRSMLGNIDSVTHSLESAIAADPRSADLWFALFDLAIKREAFGDLDIAVAQARQHGVAEKLLIPYAAVAAAELGRTEEADRLFVQWNDGTDRIWRIRHLLRSGRAEVAVPLIDVALSTERASEVWPYASLAWRLTNDARSEWLEGDETLVRVFDLGPCLPPLERLAETLRAIHVAKGEYLDQSVRGGTQTDGPLFSRIEPEVRALRAVVVTAVQDYVAQLPPLDPRHPLLGPRRDRPVRFSGSWSVRLHDAGYHVSHVHPQGWISSALYVALPPIESGADPRAGWLTLGEPPPGLIAGSLEARYIEPKPGRLVLFPSWMWHGTVPFPAGERLTVAFDVAPPR